jgi:hypothetical protein
MLFNAATLDGLQAGRVDRTYRRWTTVRPRVGSRYTTRAGVVEVTSIDLTDPAEIDQEDVTRSGFASREALLRWTAAKGSGDLYVIGLRLAGPDPRVALRSGGVTSAADLAQLDRRLDGMDRAAERPWTREALRLIERHPGVVSTELAAASGQERAYFKVRIRRLKALGLTESLEVGYRLSPRGEAYLTHLDDAPS